jgi:hypothetical protein
MGMDFGSLVFRDGPIAPFLGNFTTMSRSMRFDVDAVD